VYEKDGEKGNGRKGGNKSGNDFQFSQDMTKHSLQEGVQAKEGTARAEKVKSGLTCVRSQVFCVVFFGPEEFKRRKRGGAVQTKERGDKKISL